MTTAENIVVDGYDLLAEKAREMFPPRTLGDRSLHRGSAQLAFDDRREAEATVGDADPGRLASGMFVDTPAGVYIDLAQGQALRFVDEQHPLIRQSTADTHTGVEFARCISHLTEQRLQDMGSCETVLSPGGAAARERGIALAGTAAQRRFVKKYGPNTLSQVMDALGLPQQSEAGGDSTVAGARSHSTPFMLAACGDSFAECSPDLSAVATGSGPSLVHVPFGGDLENLEALFDDRPITELLQTPGALQQSLADGRVPSDLFAGFIVEVCQGKGGRGIADREWLGGLVAAARRREALLCIDEMQSFGRTGQLYAVEHTPVSPDILWASPAVDLGLTVWRQDLACPEFSEDSEAGSETVPPTAIQKAWATVQLLTEHKEPAFEGRTLLENSRIKGEYLRMGLAELSAAHPEILARFSGLGSLWGLQVEHRDEVLATARRMGLQLTGCGPTAEVSSIRLTLLADVLTHEVDQLTAALDRVLTAVEEAHPDE